MPDTLWRVAGKWEEKLPGWAGEIYFKRNACGLAARDTADWQSALQRFDWRMDEMNGTYATL